MHEWLNDLRHYHLDSLCSPALSASSVTKVSDSNLGWRETTITSHHKPRVWLSTHVIDRVPLNDSTLRHYDVTPCLRVSNDAVSDVMHIVHDKLTSSNNSNRPGSMSRQLWYITIRIAIGSYFLTIYFFTTKVALRELRRLPGRVRSWSGVSIRRPNDFRNWYLIEYNSLYVLHKLPR